MSWDQRRPARDAACPSAGGVVAYYPSRIPLHYRSRFLGDRDCFGELYAGCRALGMHVIARTDPHAVHDDVHAAHPDWIMVNAAGNPVRHWADPELWVTCAIGPYNFEFMTEVTREIVSRYPVDGVFANRWMGHGTCLCVHCQHNLHPATGLDLPRDGETREYLAWRQDRLFQLWDVWDAAVREIVPHARFIGEKSQILFADRQARSGPMPGWPMAARQRIPRHHGRAAHRRHFQRGRRGALLLEGLN